jgi:disulfide bond formation protein DsbB
MKLLQKILYYIALVQTIVAILSSLYLSEMLHWTPCVLCWYQRILMYPLVIFISVGILRKDKGLPLYILPMSILGACIAFYHYLLQRGVIGESLAPCQAGVSCKITYTLWFGFITIPFLSLVAFLVITACMYFAKKYHKI